MRSTKVTRLSKEDLQKQLEKQSSELEQMRQKLEFDASLEAALERVRSLSLNMKKSEELFDAIQLIMDQFFLLQINVESAALALNVESDDLDCWTAVPGALYPFKVFIPYFDHPVFNLYLDARTKGLDCVSYCVNFEEKNRWLDHVYKHLHGVPEERKKYNYNSPGYSGASAIRKNFNLNIFNYSGVPYSAVDLEVLNRFGNVFEQAYSRFLDLQKAEFNAQEAVKSASLDRVRAQTASMRSTTDLQRIIPLIWNELTTLGVHFVRCGVFIMDDDQEQIHTFLSTPEGEAIASFNTSYANSGLLSEALIYWRKKERYKTQWDEAAFQEQASVLLKQGAISSREAYLTDKLPANLHLHFLPFLQGMLYVGDVAPVSDEQLSLVQDLADAFSTAYARYQDFNQLEIAKQEVEKTLSELKATQTQLIQSEKLASLGELTAGIAHEIQNPLNFVNNFSEVSAELLIEMKEELEQGNLEEAALIAGDVIENLTKINHHGKRASSIVKGMLEHSRTSSGKKEPTDINALADECLRLTYQGLRAKDKGFNAGMETHFDEALPKIEVMQQDLGRVLINLINNAFYTVAEKAKQGIEGYQPTVSVSTKRNKKNLEIRVKDNGNGIPEAIKEKIFQPFFTTKPTGQGTGLGLSLAYDIVTKGHGGTLELDSTEGTGTVFTLKLNLI